MPTSKASAGLYLTLVFLSGAVMGGLSYRLYAVNTVSAIDPKSRPSPEEFRRRYIESIRTKVNLTPQQVDQVNQILDETRSQFDQMNARMRANGEAIRKQQIDKLNAIMRDEQKPAFAAFQTERERIRQQMREKQQKK